MKLTIKTSILQNLVSKSMRGASCNKMIPITGLMCIELKDNKLTLITTNASDYLYITRNNIDGEDFYVTVQADIFAKLISKLTCENVSLEFDNNYLKIIGNGKYTIELPLDEDGEFVKFPDPISNSKMLLSEPTCHIDMSTIQLMLNTARASLAENQDVPCYTGYYVSDKIVTTDTYKICSINLNVFDTPALISASTIDLLNVANGDRVKVYRDDDIIVFIADDCIIYSHIMDSIDDYQIDAIDGLLGQKFDSYCKISKSELLSLLDRISLFVSVYDKNGIYLTFTRNGLQIDSKQSNSTETIKYVESQDFIDFTCCIDILMFTAQIKAIKSDIVEIHYGENNAIKLVNDNTVQIIALMEYN